MPTSPKMASNASYPLPIKTATAAAVTPRERLIVHRIGDLIPFNGNKENLGKGKMQTKMA